MQKQMMLDENDNYQLVIAYNQNKFEFYRIMGGPYQYFIKYNPVDLTLYRLESDSFTKDYLLYYGYKDITEVIDRHPTDWQWRTALMIAKTEIYYGVIAAIGNLNFCQNYIFNKLKG